MGTMTSRADRAGGSPDPGARSRSGLAPDIEPDTKDWTWVLGRPCVRNHRCGRRWSTPATSATFDAVADVDWQRTGRRSNGSLFTIETLGQYLIHDLAHHLQEVHG